MSYNPIVAADPGEKSASNTGFEMKCINHHVKYGFIKVTGCCNSYNLKWCTGWVGVNVCVSGVEMLPGQFTGRVTSHLRSSVACLHVNTGNVEADDDNVC